MNNENLDELCQDCFRYPKVQDKIDTLEKTIEYAKRIEKDYKTKFDKAIEYIKTLDYENEETYDIAECVRNELLDILQGSDK